MAPITVAFVDDHPMLLHGIASSFRDRPGFAVVATGATADEAETIANEYSPDVLVMDIGLPGNAYSAIKHISQTCAHTGVLIFTASETPESAVRSIEAGARGVLLKGSIADELARGIEAVATGKLFIDPQLAATVIGAIRHLRPHPSRSQTASLTFREMQIVKMLLSGKKNKEIAETLHLSEKTVKSYMTILMQKMHARSRVEVVLAAQRLGIAPAAPDEARGSFAALV